MFTLDRANLWKRISAGLLDFIVMLILTTGFAFLISWITKYDSYSETYEEKYEYYEEKYDTNFSLTREEYEALIEGSEEKTKYDAAYKEFSEDKEVLYAWNMMINLFLIMITLSVLLSVMIVNFVIPLFLKNGQTLGKLCFNLCLVKENCVRINNIMLFVRALLGKFVIELMIPIYLAVMILFNQGGLTNLMVIVFIALANIVIILATKNHSAIHDLLAGTVVVDKESQKIYDSEDELIEAKKEMAKRE